MNWGKNRKEDGEFEDAALNTVIRVGITEKENHVGGNPQMR